MIDLLAEQPEDALVAMREAVQKELARLSVEAQQIDQALARKTRRTRSEGSSRLTREQVFEVVERAGPISPAEVQQRLAEDGIEASLNAIRNHLARLADQKGWLARLDDGRFAVAVRPATADFGGSDDDIPF